MQYLLISGALRKDSVNTQLLHMAARHLELPTDSIADLNEFAIPLYSGDIEAVGIPEGVKRLGDLVAKAQALIVSSPEYNYSVSGVLKNAIDWLSRIRPMPLTKKPLLLMTASPGQIGGIRGAWQTRIPFEGLGNYVYPEMFSLSNSYQAIANDAFTNSDDQKRFNTMLTAFQEFAKNLTTPSCT